ncbi:C-type lectin domain family 2 member D-like [Cyrtonyx montezumae]|uniref:C-type lectin domain family 2 member D-like n=1 Tax=Cyrtonyx montezumae TaxID=9017 RepID=UPI0032DA1564
MDPHRGAKDTNFSLKCIKDKLVPIAGTVLVAALLIAVISLAAQKRPSCPLCPTAASPSPGCPRDGVGVGTQCFYFVEDPADWDGAQRFCRSRGARLAAVESTHELGFLLRYGGSVHYWLGLRRDRAGPWMWSNGSLFNNAFSIAGGGHCAHTDGGGIGSDECSRPKRSVCGRPQWGARRGGSGAATASRPSPFPRPPPGISAPRPCEERALK